VSNAQRIMLVVGAVVVLVGGFILLSPGGNDAGTSSVATTPATTGAPAATTTTAAPEPATTTIDVKAGKPVGGVQAISVRKGDQVRIQVASPDTTSEVHFHGYDIKRDLRAGGSVLFAFTASAEGIFELELERTGVQIAKVSISP